MDELTPEETRMLPAIFIGPLTRMGERVSMIEGRFGAEISAIKSDTEQIRRNLHDLANRMQVAFDGDRTVAVTLAQMASKMESMTEKLAAHNDNASAIARSMQVQFDVLNSKVEALTAAKHQVEGGWWATGKTLGFLAYICSAIGAAFALVSWGLQHVTVNH
jgi:hypothetical protein